MTNATFARLGDRGVVRVTGADAEKLLQNLITADLDRLATQEAVFAGLLSPQGKILFDFFVIKTADGFLLETARNKAADLAKRLTLYKLRANVTLADASPDYDVYAAWGSAPTPDAAMAYADPRLPALGWRVIAPAGHKPSGEEASEADYHAHRIALGVPEGGRDYVLGDTFPHEALFDQIGGVDFDKGCYVGQEVVSRMQHRSTARKRVVPITSPGDLPQGAAVKLGEAQIGTVGSSTGHRALALVRLDRIGEAMGKGQPVTVDDAPITVDLPAWVRFTISTKADTGQA